MVAKAGEAAIFQRTVKHAAMHYVGGDGTHRTWRRSAAAPAAHRQEVKMAFVDDLAADFRDILLASGTPAQSYVD